MVTAEIAGFTQKYEQKVTLTPEMTYLMIKPPVLSDMPDLSTTKDTQMTLRVENTITGRRLFRRRRTLSCTAYTIIKITAMNSASSRTTTSWRG